VWSERIKSHLSAIRIEGTKKPKTKARERKTEQQQQQEQQLRHQRSLIDPLAGGQRVSHHSPLIHTLNDSPLLHSPGLQRHHLRHRQRTARHTQPHPTHYKVRKAKSGQHNNYGLESTFITAQEVAEASCEATARCSSLTASLRWSCECRGGEWADGRGWRGSVGARMGSMNAELGQGQKK
jgi:hypothetical protein